MGGTLEQKALQAGGTSVDTPRQSLVGRLRNSKSTVAGAGGETAWGFLEKGVTLGFAGQGALSKVKAKPSELE